MDHWLVLSQINFWLTFLSKASPMPPYWIWSFCATDWMQASLMLQQEPPKGQCLRTVLIYMKEFSLILLNNICKLAKNQNKYFWFTYSLFLSDIVSKIHHHNFYITLKSHTLHLLVLVLAMPKGSLVHSSISCWWWRWTWWGERKRGLA